ncbi:MAG: hypothetical protein ABSG43_07285, partial [Solirubrobacteraceae bacterium]
MTIRSVGSVLGALLVAVTALVTVTSSALAVAARIAVATAQPAAGAWKITANDSQPGPAINDLDGSFAVRGGRVADLTGVTQRRVNRGCIAGQRVTMVGSATIRHFLDRSIPADYYYVGNVNGFANVRLTFHGSGKRKSDRRIHMGTSELRIFFPGGTDTR